MSSITDAPPRGQVPMRALVTCATRRCDVVTAFPVYRNGRPYCALCAKSLDRQAELARKRDVLGQLSYGDEWQDQGIGV